MNYASLSIPELQRYALLGDEKAMLELGRRVMDIAIGNDGDHVDECPVCGAEL